MSASTEQRGISSNGAGHGGEENNPVVERMVGAAQMWLRQRAAQNGRVAVSALSPEEHTAMKARMFAAVADEVAYHPDLDRAIEYLQALGKLATVHEKNCAGKAR
jgi:hypothetical protein